MKCPNCGHMNSENAIFCGKCGEKLTEQKPVSGNTKKLMIIMIILTFVLVAVVAVFFLKKMKDSTHKVPKTGRRTEATTEQVDTSEPEEDSVVEETHTYEIVLEDCTWEEASRAAKDAGGYLVNINDEEEYDRIISQLRREGYDDQGYQFYLGALRDYDTYGYYWIDEDDVMYGDDISSYSYWASDEWFSGEPSYYDEEEEVDEYYLDMFYRTEDGAWYWNDIANDILEMAPYYSGRVGYIIEYGE